VVRRAKADDLPSDEELSRELNAKLPPEIRISKERALMAEATLRKADDRIATLGIDLDEEDRKQKELEKQLAVLPPLPSDGPPVALVILGGRAKCVPHVLSELESLLPEGSLQVLALEDICSMAGEDFAAELGMCEALAFCSACRSPFAATNDETKAVEEEACKGVATLLEETPEKLRRIVLLTDAQAGPNTCPMEMLLTRAMRERSTNATPLRYSIVRASVGEKTSDDQVLTQPVQVLGRLPAMVKDAISGLRSAYVGGVVNSVQMMMGNSDEANELQRTSPGAVAKVLEFALRRGLDVPELSVVGGGAANWGELLLPMIGPEIFRMPVEDARRMRSWLRGWVEFNYCRGANQIGAAMKKAGLKTPVEVRLSAKGACFKFMPSGSRRPGVGCAYGWNVKPREGSEQAILRRLRRDWELTQQFK